MITDLKLYMREYYIANKERILICRKKYRESYRAKEANNRYKLKLGEKFKVYQKAYNKEYRLKNRDIILQNDKYYWEKNKEKLNLKRRLRYQRGGVKELVTAYQKRNPDKVRLWRKANAHKRRINGGVLSTKVVQIVYEDNIKRYGTLTCYLCLNPVEFKKDTLEHKIPLSRGGTNEYNNLAIACRKCNDRKHAKTEQEYREMLNREIIQ